MRINSLCQVLLIVALVSCERDEQPATVSEPEGGFVSFSTNSQTILGTSIRIDRREVKLEVEHDADLTSLIPRFEVPDGYSVFIGGKEQLSGSGTVDFTTPVVYEIKDQDNRKAEWTVSTVPVSKRIVIDASHDGGVWWFPQSELTGFDQEKPHQGKLFADLLRAKGYKVDELGRDEKLKEEHFMGYFIVIRVNGFQRYTTQELDVYAKLAKRGMNLVFFTDHKKYDPADELGDMLGLQFKGVARGIVTKFTDHEITSGIDQIEYIAGSVLVNADENQDIEILGWLGDNDYADLNLNERWDTGEPYGSPVMGILSYPKSKVFFIGDCNGLFVIPQPFIDNLTGWMGKGLDN